jgi:hypothetical protein
MGIDPIARVGRYGGGRVRSRAREARASHRAREMTFSRVVSACTQGTHANVHNRYALPLWVSHRDDLEIIKRHEKLDMSGPSCCML